MKRNVVLAAAFALMALAVSASAQKASDFSGTWVLDVSKSIPAENMIESQTFIISQSPTAINVERKTKVNAEGERMRGGMGNPEAPVTYTLDGKAVESEMQTRGGAMKVKTVAKLDGGKFEINRTIATPMGDRTMVERWWLNADGTLSVENQRPNRDGGMDTVTRIYKKS
jgi:hypothetical protein